jgi:hypothetical protein
MMRRPKIHTPRVELHVKVPPAVATRLRVLAVCRNQSVQDLLSAAAVAFLDSATDQERQACDGAVASVPLE